MANTLVQQRCFIHADREAASRCPRCRRYYCRECVSEFEDQVVCAACLRQVKQAAAPVQKRASWLTATAQIVVSLVLAWFFFYSIGQVLLLFPSTFHTSFQENK